MRNYLSILTLCLMLFLCGTRGMATEMATPVGEWLVKDKTAHVRIINCNERIWGIISWAKDPGKDENNPDVKKRNRSVIGMPILLGMQAGKAGEWDGNIYNSDNGKTYQGSIALKSVDILHVEGCVLGILCGGEDWMRIAPPYDKPEITCRQVE